MPDDTDPKMRPPPEDERCLSDSEPEVEGEPRPVQEELQRQAQSLRETSSRIADLEGRLRELEERTGKAPLRGPLVTRSRPEVDIGSPEGRRRLERWVHHLQDAVEHLAADGAELRRQVAIVVTLLEEQRDAGALLERSRSAGGGKSGFTLKVVRTVSRATKRVLRPLYRAARSLAGRLLRFVQRRIPSRWSRRPGEGEEVRLSVGRCRPIPSPALSVVISVDRFEREEIQELTDGLRQQTATSVEWLLWSVAEGTVEVFDATWNSVSTRPAADAATLRRTMRGALATTAIQASQALPASWLEMATWTALAENLPLVRLAPEDSAGRWVCHPDPTVEGHQVPADLVVTRRNLWAPDGLEVEEFLRLAAERARILGRVVRQIGDFGAHPGDRGRLLPGEAGRAVRLSGDYMVASRQPRSLFHHTVYPLNEVLLEDPVEDSRRTVLVLLPFLAIGGAEKLTYDLMRKLGERFRFVVVTLAPHDAVLGDRLEDFRRLTPNVYTLGESLSQLLLVSAVEHLVGKYRVETLFNANGTTWFYESLPALRYRHQDLTIVNQLFDHREGWIEYYNPDVVEQCDIHLATNDAIEDVLLSGHEVPPMKIRKIPHGIDLEEFRSLDYTRERRAALREELGVPEDAVLVTMAVRMHPQKRPEDFVLLANSMKEDEELYFLLVGGGPLDGTINDLIDYYDLDNLCRLGFYSPIADLLAVSDVACMMSEYEALPLYVLSALAMETPVVATAVGAIESVLTQGLCGIVIPKVGDIEAFSGAITSLKDPARRRDLGRAGRSVVEERFGIERAAEAYARVFEVSVARTSPRVGAG